ncbi:TonB-dependent receptor [uncultured Parabacteroides sp.]|uniref:SusC/RagA family TonB-linked outer membrane protein n=1 Tax=uncultured Parabacteroides sp. TaxID=512312 RepID=UPI002637E3BA|nr:TonB-dependent receptor [uncultured Parabacteroides sp.]
MSHLKLCFLGALCIMAYSHVDVYAAESPLPIIQEKGKTLKCRVVDKEGNPIIGASVVEKGSNGGVITDLNGYFTLQTGDDPIIQISYIGFQTKTLKGRELQNSTIVLQEDTQNIEEVVVVGYGVQKKVNLTGAVSDIKSDLLENRTASTMENLLAGNIAGVTIQQTSGQPGHDAGTVRVRGIGTLGNSDAMVLIDGIESTMSNVDPNDIESISVLKDAAASAIYGVRAANGVVLITTKKGKSGKPAVSYNGYVGWQHSTRLPKYLDSYNYATLLNEAYTNDGLNPVYSDPELQTIKNGSDPDHFANTDQLALIFSENGLFHNHYLNVNGGSDAVKYAFSVGYHNKEGVMPGTNFSRYNFRSNVEAKINKRLDLSLNLRGHRTETTEPASGVGSIVTYAYRESPLFANRYQNGKYGLYQNEHNSLAFLRNSGESKIDDNNFEGNVSLSFKVIDGLEIRGIASARYDVYSTHEFLHNMSFYTPESEDPVRNMRSSVSDSETKLLETNLQAFLNYEKTFGRHSFKGMLGYSQLYNQVRSSSMSRYDLPLNNSIGEINAGDATTQKTEGNVAEYALRSGFARVNYSFDNRYLFEANLRYDGTSRFPKDNRFGLFPSLSAAWRISEESFIDASWLDNLKLRMSWGLLGNQEIGNYLFLNTYGFGNYYTFGNSLIPGISISGTMSNEAITWEKTKQFDLGVDFDILQGKFGFTGDFYVKNTDDILLKLPVPSIIGVKAPMQNAGKVRNIGFDLQLRHTNQINDFKYNSVFNLGYVHNEITDLAGGDTPGRSVGDPVKNIYGYVCEGIFNSQEEIDNHPKQIWGAVPGDLKYKDLNGDNIVDDKDRKSLGSSFPKVNFGLSFGMEYKKIDFSFLMQGAAAVNAIPVATVNKAFYNGGKVTEKHLDRWTPDNLNASYPRLSIGGSAKNWYNSTFWMNNASYLRMKNIQLGYTLPKDIINKMRVERLRLYCSIDNLFTLSGFEELDPETLGQTTYPMSISYSFGMNLSF